MASCPGTRGCPELGQDSTVLNDPILNGRRGHFNPRSVNGATGDGAVRLAKASDGAAVGYAESRLSRMRIAWPPANAEPARSVRGVPSLRLRPRGESRVVYDQRRTVRAIVWHEAVLYDRAVDRAVGGGRGGGS